MPIFTAAILDVAGRNVLIPSLQVHFVTETKTGTSGVFRLARYERAPLKIRGKYRMTLEDGRTGEFLIHEVRYEPDGTTTLHFVVNREESANLSDLFED